MPVESDHPPPGEGQDTSAGQLRGHRGHPGGPGQCRGRQSGGVADHHEGQRRVGADGCDDGVGARVVGSQHLDHVARAQRRADRRDRRSVRDRVGGDHDHRVCRDRERRQRVDLVAARHRVAPADLTVGAPPDQALAAETVELCAQPLAVDETRHTRLRREEGRCLEVVARGARRHDHDGMGRDEERLGGPERARGRVARSDDGPRRWGDTHAVGAAVPGRAHQPGRSRGHPQGDDAPDEDDAATWCTLGCCRHPGLP